ncbi:uncharacterized protein LOC127288776 [Leptopilina boulardi]|uniref:uncharacterized protein LOC127288776 n=1 Tax=Leptopilina boulardi TaxID=63433 RepID=UPI0021F69D0F|nr:uncharacterized protein LOC127288776 [Leptopilina boulardi]
MDLETDGNSRTFAVIQFDDKEESIEIIRTDWGFFNDENVLTGAYFPVAKSVQELDQILKENSLPSPSWTNDGKPWPVKRFFRFASTFEEALKKQQYASNLSVVVTDDEKNEDAMKQSRHLRCRAVLSTDSKTELESIKRKPKFIPMKVETLARETIRIRAEKRFQCISPKREQARKNTDNELEQETYKKLSSTNEKPSSSVQEMNDLKEHEEMNFENRQIFYEDTFQETKNVEEVNKFVEEYNADGIIEKNTEVNVDVLQKIDIVIANLAEYIDDEDNKENYEEIRVHDNFFDCLDQDDFAIDAEEESTLEKEFISAEKKYVLLEDLMEDSDFNKPIEVTINRTVGEVIIMIIKYALIHALSFTATFHLFRLVNCFFEYPILPNTKYILNKLFYPKKWMTFHAICPECTKYVGTFESEKTKFINCRDCNIQINVKDYEYKDFFLTMDPSFHIKNLIEANSDYYNYVVKTRLRKESYINDVYDGKLYRKFVKSLSADHKHTYATVTFNTDGAPLFKSSNCAIWPIYLMVNELPFNIRSKELILAGLWFGKGKPDMNIFLNPFVQNMNELSTKGVECVLDGIKNFIKIFPLICCVDAVARAPVQGFVQFNAKYGCGQCLHPGEYIRKSKKESRSGCIKYPLLSTVSQKRNQSDTIKHAEEATSKPFLGVKTRSPLFNLKKFDLIRGCVPDSMHLVSGVAKQFAKMLFGNKEKVGLISRKKITEIDTILKNIKSPHQVGRLSRPFSEREYWKAREWENFTFFYSIPVFIKILPLDYLNHWSFFVEAIYILSTEEIKVSEIDLADELLHKFVAGTEKLYSKWAMTFNIHSLLHLANSVSDWGPLWAHNAYPFESENGRLLRSTHSTKGIHHQICRHVSLQSSLNLLEKRVDFSFFLRQFCILLANNKVEKTVNISSQRYFGASSSVSRVWIQNLNLSFEHSCSYIRMVKNNCLFMSDAKINKRSNNTYALITNKSYVKIKSFIVDRFNKLEYTIVQKLFTTNALGSKCNMLKKVENMSEEFAILTNTLETVCVFIEIDNDSYICALPNLKLY